MALSGRLLVTPEELEKQANITQNTINRMRNSFDSLEQLIQGSQSYWTGEASDAHRQAYQSLRGRVDEMFLRYQDHVSDLETVAGIHRENEMSLDAMIDELPDSNL